MLIPGVELNIEHSASQSTDPRTSFINMVDNEVLYRTLDPNSFSSSTEPGKGPTVADAALNGYTMLSTAYSVTSALQSMVDNLKPNTEHNLQRPLSDFVRGPSAKEGRCIIFITGTDNADRASELAGHGRDWTKELTAEEGELLFDKFSLTSVQEPSDERYQITETFDANILYLFDEKPKIYNFTGKVINAKGDYDWKNDLQRKYNDHYRGTLATKNGKVVYITYEDTMLKCVLLQMNMNFSSTVPSAVDVSFVAFVLDTTQLTSISKDNREEPEEQFEQPLLTQPKNDPIRTPPKTKDEVTSDLNAVKSEYDTLKDEYNAKAQEYHDIGNDINNIQLEYDDAENEVDFLNFRLIASEGTKDKLTASESLNEAIEYQDLVKSQLEAAKVHGDRVYEEGIVLDNQLNEVESKMDAADVSQKQTREDSGEEAGYTETVFVPKYYEPITAEPGNEISSDGTTTPPAMIFKPIKL